MSHLNSNEADLGIIGGGLSGLFASYILNKHHKDVSFLAFNSTSRLGGYASLGGMKIGLLPAGNKTAEILSYDFYKKATDEFIDLFIPSFRGTKYEPKLIIKEKSFFNKFYLSSILTKNLVYKLIAELKADTTNNIKFDNIKTIHLNSDRYIIKTSAGKTFQFKTLIIATGRDEKVINKLKNIGCTYDNKPDLLIGCRALFQPNSATKYFIHQPDFKLKFKNGFQTYCFNHTGKLLEYNYSLHKFYSGTYKKTSNIGNVFLGKREKKSYTEALNKYTPGVFSLDGNIEKDATCKNILDSDYRDELLNTVADMRDKLGFNFKSFYFPALEQFWDRPDLKPNSLESKQLSNLYFIGDASGIAFGVLQCYITAKFALEEIRRKNVFP